MGSPTPLARIRLQPLLEPQAPAAPRACSVKPWMGEVSDEVVCDGVVHFRQGQVRQMVGMCPAWQALGRAARIDEERRRLAPRIARLRLCPRRTADHRECDCAVQFARQHMAAFDGSRSASAGRALAATRAFVEGKARGLFFVGPSGLGKTHLLLASHFALLERGVRSAFVASSDLYPLFADAESFDDERRLPALTTLQTLWSKQVVHLDELGEGPGDASGRFFRGIKGAFDRSSIRFAVASNRSLDELSTHPDVTSLLISRFRQGASEVLFDATEMDQRLRPR